MVDITLAQKINALVAEHYGDGTASTGEVVAAVGALLGVYIGHCGAPLEKRIEVLDKTVVLIRQMVVAGENFPNWVQ